MKEQVEILHNGWRSHERKVLNVTEEITQSNSRTIDTLHVIEEKLIQRVKDDMDKYRQDVIDAQNIQVNKIEAAYDDLQEKKQSMENFINKLENVFNRSDESDIQETADSLKRDFALVMNRNKVTDQQMKTYKVFGIIEPDSFNVLVSGLKKIIWRV